MELHLTATGGKVDKKSKVDVSDIVFGSKFNEPLIHQVVVAYQAAGRQGTSAQKTRSDVRGGGAKPWKQKGTGRARAGTIRSPIFRSGGVTFASRTRDYTQKVNKKMYRVAMRSILSELIRQERIMFVDEFNVEAPKTKALIAKLGDYELKSALIVKDSIDTDLYLASRNIPRVEVRDVAGLDPVGLLSHRTVVMTVAAVKKLEESLA